MNLVVAIGCFWLFVSLVIPAVRIAMVRSRMTHTSEKQRHLARALLQYHNGFEAFPIGHRPGGGRMTPAPSSPRKSDRAK